MFYLYGINLKSLSKYNSKYFVKDLILFQQFPYCQLQTKQDRLNEQYTPTFLDMHIPKGTLIKESFESTFIDLIFF